MVKGQYSGKEEFLFLEDLTCSSLGITVEGLPWQRVWTLQTQLPGPHGAWAMLPLHLRAWLPLSQGRLTSLARALFWLIKEEQPLRAEASPFHPGALFCRKHKI